MLQSSRKGAMSVWLVVMIVFAVVMLATLYAVYARNQQLQATLAKCKREADAFEKKASDTLQEIDDWKALVGQTNIEDVKTRVKEADLTPPADNLHGLLDKLVFERNEARTLAKSMKVNVTQIEGDLKMAKAQLTEMRAAKQKELAEANKRAEDLQRKNKEIESGYQSQVAQLKAQISKLKADNGSEREAYEEDKRKMEFQLNTRREQTRQLVEKLRMAKGIHPEIDGRVVVSDLTSLLVSIDIGRAEGLKPGVVFRVYQFTRTGHRITKGRIRVKTVGKNSSTARIIEYIKTKPLIKGDFVESIFFPPGASFVVLGLFDPKKTKYSKQEIENLIKRYGGKIEEEPNMDTSFSVEGERDLEDPEQEKLFTLAREYRVPIVTVEDFVRYLPDLVE